MEASDTSGQPPVEPGQSDATGQDQSQGDQPAQSQEQPQDDSQLTTPQPDQQVPNETERQQTDDSQVSQPEAATAEAGPSGQPAEGTVAPPQFPTGAQQEQAAVDRYDEQDAARQQHNERTGGGETQPGELQQARQDHNDRVGGGQVPGVEPQASQPADGSG
jgi:hypothetical protein